MTYRMYLHDDIINTLNVFGDLSTVTERIILEALEHNVDIESLPKAGDRTGATRKNITLFDPQVIEYLDSIFYYNSNAPKSPIRNLLYWFVNEEMYNEWSWEPVKDFVEKDETRKTYIRTCEQSLCYLNNDKLKRAIKILRDLLEE